ncbi:outer membrane protein assembly factor BamE [uncultured Jannaschia sp.]|uniref:outer membrane protein assembly factor BamE n=1 Tax=uncultured Jannaschia sp. TaxID=293347 RepID=UPI002611A8F8|nr:outer membrane protein assembly factor BamE [uncultured Jannaschia sp.]
MTTIAKRLLVAVLCFGLAACAATYRNHGYVPEPEALAALDIGVDSRETVEAAVGRPATSGVERSDAWYYVQSRVRHYGAFPRRTIDRQLVALSFAPNGTLANIERFGLERGRVVPLSRRVTASSIRDFGLIQQIFRNFGRINVGETLADSI